MIRQLPLGLRFPPDISFETFVNGTNAEALAAIQACARGAGEGLIFVWGAAGVGKSHLLQAACRLADSAGRRVAYIPLREAGSLAPALLEGLEAAELVALDDVQRVAGDAAWEQALFGLFNRCRERNSRLLVSADGPPDRLALGLADLATRLGSGPSYRLEGLDDDQRLVALRHAAMRRGLELPSETGRYLLHRHSRDLRLLFDLLERLDQASLAAQRKLTIPFVREVLSQPAAGTAGFTHHAAGRGDSIRGHN